MQTFSVEILGCKVNQYEGEQLSALLRSRGLRPAAGAGEAANLRIIHTCSVTVQAAARSRQLARRSGRMAGAGRAGEAARAPGSKMPLALPQLAAAPRVGHVAHVAQGAGDPARPVSAGGRVVVTGCWATSNRAEAAALAGVDAVIGHDQDVAAELSRLLDLWQCLHAEPPRSELPNTRYTDQGCGSGESASCRGQGSFQPTPPTTDQRLPEPLWNEGWNNQAGSPEGKFNRPITPSSDGNVNGKMRHATTGAKGSAGTRGTMSLPLLSERQRGRQRAHLKVQDGCDAHCTYCIIPRLRGAPRSKPIDDAVQEASRLVAAGHVELVLTGIFLGAYGRETALRRRQGREPKNVGEPAPLARLVDALCTRVEGLRRVRFSSLEPGDLTDELISVLRSHPQVVPHFHLPLQSGSDVLLRRMNRQYRRDDYLRMVERVRSAFDRPALTTDIIVGFPGETEQEFLRTLEVVDFARFIHVHAFSFSPRPGTAAARWTDQFVRGPVVNERIHLLRQRAKDHSLKFREQFVGQSVDLLVERDEEEPGGGDSAALADEAQPIPARTVRHGRSERYFSVYFDDSNAKPGDYIRVRIEQALEQATLGVRETFAIHRTAAAQNRGR